MQPATSVSSGIIALSSRGRERCKPHHPNAYMTRNGGVYCGQQKKISLLIRLVVESPPSVRSSSNQPLGHWAYVRRKQTLQPPPPLRGQSLAVRNPLPPPP